MFAISNENGFIRKLSSFFSEGRRVKQEVEEQPEIVEMAYGINEILKTSDGFVVFPDAPKASPIMLKYNEVSFIETEEGEVLVIYRQLTEVKKAVIYLKKENMVNYK